MIGVGRIIRAEQPDLTPREADRLEVSKEVVRAMSKAMERTPSAPSMKLITSLLERYENGCMSRAELFERLRKTS